MKRNRLVALVLVMLLCATFFSPTSVASNASDIKSRLDTILQMEKYKPGPNGNRWYNRECWKFVKAISNELFGVDIPTGPNGLYYLTGAGSNANWSTIGSYSGGSATQEDIISLLKGAQSGDIIQFRSKETPQHTVMIYSVNNNSITLYHQASKYGVKLDSIQWSDLCKWNNDTASGLGTFNTNDSTHGLSLYRCNKPIIESKPNSSGVSSNGTAVVSTQKIQIYNTTNITQTTAKVNATCTYTGTRPSSVGLYLGTTESNMSARGSDIIDHNQNPFGIWYNLSELSAGTTYYYQFYAAVNGQAEPTKSEIKSFTTLPSTTPTKGSISLSRTSLTMKDTECVSLEAVTTPAGQNVNWTSSNPAVATVDRGNIVALKAGTTTITAALASNSAVKAQCVVTVTAEVKPKISLTVKGASNIAQNTARVDASCSYTGTRPTSVGLYLGTSTSNMSAYGSDNINHNQNPFDVWYNLRGLFAGTTYYYRFYAMVNDTPQWSDIRSFTTENAVIEDPISGGFAMKGSSNITQSTARVDASYSYTGMRPSSVGLYLGTSSSNMSAYGSDTINHNQNPFDVWYNLSGLSAGATYYYRFYATVNGETIWSDISNFTTTAAPISQPQTQGAVSLTHKGASSITQTTARVDASCSYTGTRPSSVGLYLGTSASNMSAYGSDHINHNQNPFDIWYNLKDLSAGTTYYYRFYAIVNGETKWSDTRTFTTSAAASVSVNTRTGIVTGTNGSYLAINDKPAASPANSTQIGRIPPGGQITVYTDKTSGNWYWVEYNGVQGYAYKNYITLR